jgi:predicted transport protein
VDIVPQKSRLRLSLNIPFEEIDDPQGICKDVSQVGRWGNGDTEVGIGSLEQIDYIMSLIQQAYDWQEEE